jgi:hypothetical protein
MIFQGRYLQPVSQRVPLKIQSDLLHNFPWWFR